MHRCSWAADRCASTDEIRACTQRSELEALYAASVCAASAGARQAFALDVSWKSLVLHQPHQVCVLLSFHDTSRPVTSKVGCVGIFGLDACFGRACSILRRAEWCGYCGVWSRGLDGLRTRQHCCMTPRCSSSGKATRPVGSLPLPLLRVCLTAPSVWCIVHRSAFAIFHVVNQEWWSESRNPRTRSESLESENHASQSCCVGVLGLLGLVGS